MSQADVRMVVHAPFDGGEHWLNFTSPREIIEAHEVGEVRDALQRIEAASKEGAYAVGFVSYEAAPAFDSAFSVQASNKWPLVYFGIYDSPERIEAPSSAMPSDGCAPVWTSGLSEDQYSLSIATIKQHLQAGDTYQVNYSFPLRSAIQGSAYEHFCTLVEGQQTPYSTFIETPDFAICSASPELFFELDKQRLVSRPMKGTAPRGVDSEEDARIIETLSDSDKNRAENVMIVDMVRNDMGRIAKPGSVRVTRSCEWETYPTLHQMVSEVECITEASLVDVFGALFPCASITGAPKVRTTQLIEELEGYSRGAYTGAIGWVFPGQHARFNVGIRTMTIDRQTSTAVYPVGSGILWDSDSHLEYEECMMKAGILRAHKEFHLLETIRLEDGCYELLDRHLARVLDSASYFGIPATDSELRTEVLGIAEIHSQGRFKVRLLVDRQGDITTEHSSLDKLPEQPITLRLDTEPSSTNSPFCRHKTTQRDIYSQARARTTNCEDVILWNPEEYVTETSIANLLLRRAGRWVTPPLIHGLLPGTYRQELLDSGEIHEEPIHRTELGPESELILINSVRGRMPAVLLP